MVTGRATDNEVGSALIRERMGVAAFNALTQETDLGECIRTLLPPMEAQA